MKFPLLTCSVAAGFGLATIFVCPAKSPDNLFDKTQSAKTIRIKTGQYLINEPIYLTGVDNQILVGNFFSDPMINIYTLTDRNSILKPTHALSRGKAPNELLTISSLHVSNRGIFIYSAQEYLVFWLSKTNLHPGSTPIRTLSMQDKLRNDWDRFHLLPIARNRYIATGLLDPEVKSQFALLDSTLRVTRYFDSFPVEGTPMANLSFPQQSMGFQGWMTITPDGKRMMWTSKPGSIFRFYDLSYQRPLKTKEYILNIPVFYARTDTDTGIEQDRDNEWGVLNATANDSCFFALYSPKRIAERSLESNDIYVFDLRGNPLKHIVLDRPATHIVWVPGEGGKEDHIRGLYMFGRNEESLEPEIFKVVY